MKILCIKLKGKANSMKLQEVLSKHSENITTRLGLNIEENEKDGVIIITVKDNVHEIMCDITNIEGATVQFMEM